MIVLPKGIEPTVDQTQIKRNKLVFVGCIQVTKYSSKMYTGVREMFSILVWSYHATGINSEFPFSLLVPI